MMLSSQVLGSRPGQPVSYPNIGKDEVLCWFRNAPGATRIDTLCGLLDSCVPFEIRFMGSVLETFGRKEFHQLRDMTDRANKVYNKKVGSLEDNVMTFFQSIIGKDDDTRRVSSVVSRNSNTPNSSTGSAASNFKPHAATLPAVNTNSQSHLNIVAKSSSSHQLQPQPPSSVNETSQLPTNRPVPAHKTETLRTLPVYEPPQLRQQISRNHSPVVANIPAPIPAPMVNGIGTGKRSNCSSEDETDSPNKPKDLRVLEFVSSRQKLVLYLSLLSSTNHEAALVYYSLISQVNKTVGDNEWMEQQSEATLEEVTLLYTLGIHHPAFSYEQRLMLSEILVKVRRELQRKKTQAFAQAYSPVQVYEPQYGHPHGPVYFHISSMAQSHLHSSVQSLEHMGTPPPQHPPGSSGGPQGIPSSMTRTVPIVDTSRLPPTPQINFYQQIPFPTYQGLGSSTHPQNPSYINASPLVTNVGPLSSAIRSTSPSNIPTPVLGNEGVAISTTTTANKVEKLPPPLYEKIPVPPLDTNSTFQQIPRQEKVSCFNCGQQGHLGQDCESATIGQMSHHIFRLNFEDNNNKNKTN